MSSLSLFENELRSILRKFTPVHLEELSGAKLMYRVDTKFIFHRETLPQLLKQLCADYRILTINGKQIMKYESLYLDGRELPFYLAHHNGHDHRFKVRFRKYVDSQTTFLEVKEKRKGRTQKTRIEVADFEHDLSSCSASFVRERINIKDLHPKLWNTYDRITLVNDEKQERVTLDLGLNYEWDGRIEKFTNLAIAELKQERIDRSSVFFQLLKSLQIRPSKLSKYCTGMIMLYGESQIKYNRFKRKIKRVNTINNDIRIVE